MPAGNYAAIENSPLAEQKNAAIRNLQNQVAYMNQTTFMWYMRYFLYRMNRMQQRRDAGLVFWHKPH